MDAQLLMAAARQIARSRAEAAADAAAAAAAAVAVEATKASGTESAVEAVQDPRNNIAGVAAKGSGTLAPNAAGVPNSAKPVKEASPLEEPPAKRRHLASGGLSGPGALEAAGSSEGPNQQRQSLAEVVRQFDRDQASAAKGSSRRLPQPAGLQHNGHAERSPLTPPVTPPVAVPPSQEWVDGGPSAPPSRATPQAAGQEQPSCAGAEAVAHAATLDVQPSTPATVDETTAAAQAEQVAGAAGVNNPAASPRYHPLGITPRLFCRRSGSRNHFKTLEATSHVLRL